MGKTAKIIVGLVILGLGVLALRMTLFGPSDRELINQALAESVQAGKEGRPGGVLEFLSQNLTYNGEQVVDRRQIADFVRKAKPEVQFGQIDPEIRGEDAQVETSAHVKVSGFGISIDRQIPKVTIVLKRERATRWLVFPSSQWRIVSVSASPEALSDLLPSF